MLEIPLRRGISRRAKGVAYASAMTFGGFLPFTGPTIRSATHKNDYAFYRSDIGLWHGNYISIRQNRLCPYAMTYYSYLNGDDIIENYYFASIPLLDEYSLVNNTGEMFNGYHCNRGWSYAHKFDGDFKTESENIRLYMPDLWIGYELTTGMAHDGTNGALDTGTNLLTCGYRVISYGIFDSRVIQRHDGFSETVTDEITGFLTNLDYPSGPPSFNVIPNGIAWNSNTNDLLSVEWSNGTLWEWMGSPAQPVILKHDGFSSDIIRWADFPMAPDPLYPLIEKPIPWGMAYDSDGDMVIVAANIGNLAAFPTPDYPETQDFMYSRVYRFVEADIPYPLPPYGTWHTFTQVDFIEFDKPISGIEWVDGNLIRISPSGRYWVQDGFSTDVLKTGRLWV